MNSKYENTDMKMQPKKQRNLTGFFNLLSIAGLAGCALLAIWAYKNGILNSVDSLQTFIWKFGYTGMLVFILIQVVQVIIPILPGGVSCLGGVIFFGPWLGFLYNYIGICIGSIAVFGISKTIGRPVLYKMFSEKMIEKYDGWTQKDGKFLKLFALAIFFPVAPDDFLCYLAGTTKMTWKQFTAVIVLGKPFSIALLHDIGRFEQLKRYDSFEPGTMDHAAYGVKVLFDEGMIRRFLPDDKWDSIIYTAIAHHSDYELPEISDPQTLLHAKLIRDEDKLDNCRVKLVDSTSTFINVSEEELGTQNITQKIYETVFKNKCILSADRVTQMDYWVSYIVYFFDINFKESFDIIAENDYLNRIIDRIPYSNPSTKKQMKKIRTYMQKFINSHTGSRLS